MRQVDPAGYQSLAGQDFPETSAQPLADSFIQPLGEEFWVDVGVKDQVAELMFQGFAQHVGIGSSPGNEHDNGVLAGNGKGRDQRTAAHFLEVLFISGQHQPGRGSQFPAQSVFHGLLCPGIHLL